VSEPQIIDNREFWSCVGEHISEAFVRGYADKIRPLNRSISDDLLNIAEHSNRLAVENRELQFRALTSEQARLRYFVVHWPQP
jgi:hypothetical protein